MFDHVGFGVTDLEASKAFFLKALQPPGITVVMEGPYGVGLGRNQKPSLWLHQTSERPAHLHVAIAAENRRQVDEFYRAALAAGGKVTHYKAMPEYQGRSVIPIAIKIVASDPGEFITIINIWGEALARVADA